jgi:hypothetical protein
VVAKDDRWFVKLDEDTMPNFKETKRRLKELSNTVHEELKGDHDFFLRQADRTRPQWISIL